MKRTSVESTLLVLQSLLDIHRNRVIVACSEDCMCWDIETLINTFEKTTGSSIRENITVSQNLGDNSGTVVGLQIKNL